MAKKIRSEELSKKQLAHQKLKPDQKADLRLAASNMTGTRKRAFQAEMALKYCGGSARLSETVFGWNRKSVKLGLAEKKTGITCQQAKSGRSGRKPWEEKNAQVAQSLRNLAEANVQQDPTFNSTIGYTRLTASKALAQLKQFGYQEAQLPKPTTMNQVLNRMGYRLRKIVKAKPQKNCQKPTGFLRISKTKTHAKAELSESV
jgi:hypothetical protein